MTIFDLVARKSNQSEGDQQKSPPVNIQMSRNSHRRSIQLDQSSKTFDFHISFYCCLVQCVLFAQ